eukprot:GHVP01002279.1.p1 GENE.GHVP01002279.1~~GHVP01002279.1.p1  ORF type:complete len:130 (+),score=18.60 GHVP01002279.1:461-850(+)
MGHSTSNLKKLTTMETKVIKTIGKERIKTKEQTHHIANGHSKLAGVVRGVYGEVIKANHSKISKSNKTVPRYQDDVAIAGTSIDQMNPCRTCMQPGYWDPISTKPLLKAIWAPLRISQKPEAISIPFEG